MDSGIGGALRRMWSMAEGAAIAVGGALAPVLIEMGQAVTAVGGRIAGLPSTHGRYSSCCGGIPGLGTDVGSKRHWCSPSSYRRTLVNSENVKCLIINVYDYLGSPIE